MQARRAHSKAQLLEVLFSLKMFPLGMGQLFWWAYYRTLNLPFFIMSYLYLAPHADTTENHSSPRNTVSIAVKSPSFPNLKNSEGPPGQAGEAKVPSSSAQVITSQRA